MLRAQSGFGKAFLRETDDLAREIMRQIDNIRLFRYRIDGLDRQPNGETKIKGYAFKVKPFATGLSIDKNTIYMLDHATKQLLVMDASNDAIEKSYFVSQVSNPQGLFVQGGKAYVLNAAKGKNCLYIYQLPAKK